MSLKPYKQASSTVIVLSEHYNKNIPHSFNRKEIKDHREDGILLEIH
ncbi:22625_t:CDS:2 [Dentiscutata erythropus]|uniref:22625_t:CDS:1 n=1 Tax=Dentiscutata erythropus TaxID=1348616 RepID=A0A9N9CVN5_9GLOM|nr:22625_t:CDS:2 [Dentiscutata erythropus]